MIQALRWALGAAVRPWRAFPGPFATSGDRLGALVLLRLPPALLEGWLGLRAAQAVWREIVSLQGPWGGLLKARLPDLSPEDVRAAFETLPPLPAPGPWLLLAVPLGLAGLWLHHVAWDHLALWLVGGLKTGRGWRTTALAEAEALVAGGMGVWLGCLAYAPGGWLLGPLWVLLGAWFWGLRGFALAAHHGCEPWRGVVATLVHGGLMILFFGGLLLLMVLLALGTAVA